MTTLILKHRDWNQIRPGIDQDYGKVTTMISWRLKETLGFTVRHHTGHNPINGHYIDDIRLDFVNEASLIFFQLKYCNRK